MSSATQQVPPAGAVRSLPIMDTVSETYRRFFHLVRYLPRILLVPLLAYGAILALVIAFIIPVGPDRQIQDGPASGFGFLLVSVAALALIIVFGVAWQRLVLLGSGAAPPWIPRWRRREWRTLGNVLLLLLFTVLTLFALGIAFALLGESLVPLPGRPSGVEVDAAQDGLILPFLKMMLVLFFVFLIWLRLGFVFPAVAVDEAYGLRMAWRHSKGQGSRMLIVAVLISLPLLILSVAMSGVYVLAGGLLATSDATAVPPLINIVIFIGNLLVGLVSYAVYFAFISIAFETCTGWVPPITTAGAVKEEDTPALPG